jgi:hypothetical protein
MSKLMSESHALDSTSFTSPRNPKMTDIQLQLIQTHWVRAKQHGRRITEKHGLLGGFGTLQNMDIKTEMTDPVWIPEGDKGRWKESVVYTANLILRCPPTVNTRLIQSQVSVFRIIISNR